MNYNVIAYFIYAPIVIGLTIWVAKMLHKNTMAFLFEIFREHTNVATATNNLLQVGFYLISLGFGFVRLRIRVDGHWDSNNNWIQADLESYRQMIEQLAMKTGAFTLFIGFILFLNLFLMLLLRRTGRNKHSYTNIPVQGQQQMK